jgi:uncharacterized phage protein (TIGR01671 family)
MCYEGFHIAAPGYAWVWTDHTYTDSRVLNAPVMQFTGLKDKNGKEIFEGDILQTVVNVCINKLELKTAGRDDLFIMPEFEMQKKLCRVDWYNGVRVSGWRLLGKDKRYQTQLKWSTVQNMRIEIIGNIYETPNLLQP